MSLADELCDYAKNTHKSTWERRDGQKVPSTDDLGLGNETVDFDAVVLYVDLKDSTGLVKVHSDGFASEVYKNYLYTVSKIIRAHNGSMTAFDGDRIMGVFIRGSKNNNATKVALKINWAVKYILQLASKDQYPNTTYTLE